MAATAVTLLDMMKSFGIWKPQIQNRNLIFYEFVFHQTKNNLLHN